MFLEAACRERGFEEGESLMLQIGRGCALIALDILKDIRVDQCVRARQANDDRETRQVPKTSFLALSSWALFCPMSARCLAPKD